MPLPCMRGICVCFGLCLSFFLPRCDGGNILVYSLDGSHWINMKVLLEELHARGHNITVLRPSTSWYIPEKSPLFSSISFEMREKVKDFFDEFIENHLRVHREGTTTLTFFKIKKVLLSMITKGHALWCDGFSQVFDNPEILKSLIDSQYDLVLTDPGIAPAVVLAKYLKLPLVLNARWITSGEGHFVMAPSPLSYIPVPGSGLTDNMNFIQRVKNVLFYSIILFQEKVLLGPIYDAMCKKYMEGGCDIVSLLQEADIWLFRSDFVFDFPRPTMPNIVYVGGYQCKPAQPLPADLEDFVQSAGEHGVIIMTLGSLVNALPKEVAEDIASVFAKMPQKVIWKHKGERPSTVGNNTQIVDWMPQMDLLGHPQVKLFIAHGGTNGVQEAIYYGVPVLGIPLFFDQYDNLLRLQERGGAIILELAEINGPTFEEGIKEVLYKDTYRQNMQRLSSLHRDQPVAPMEKAIFWIEYVIRHKGARHLVTEAYKMPWYSYYCIDVMLFLITVIAVLLLSIFAIFRFFCCRKKRNTKVKQRAMPLHRVCRIFMLFSLCVVFFTPQCNGGNILVFPVDGSHWINMEVLLEELHARGHNITVIRPSTSWYIPEKSPLYSSITIKIHGDTTTFFNLFIQEQMKARRETASLLTFIKITKGFFSMITEGHSLWCDSMAQIFDDPKMVKSLKDSQYDLLLADPGIGIGVVLAKYLKLPLVFNARWLTSGEGHFVMAPSPLSYIPVLGSGLTDKMNFHQRVKNVLFYSLIWFQEKFLMGPIYDSMCKKYMEGGCDIVSLFQDADIWLFRTDFVFDFPRPTMPNVVYIGGFQCKPAQPLPADLEDFVQSAGEHGVIIMTLGSMITALPKEVAEEIASVFAKMPQKVIWRHKGERPSTLGNSTLMMDWMPQKDLLGHPQVKLFVTHGGTNGLQEAIYNGVPVLGIPLIFDQHDNLIRMQERGAAKMLELADINGHTFEEGIKEVLYKDSYRKNMQRLSSLHRDQPVAPIDKAIFWTEYVMRHKGARHLRTEAYKMPWYSYYCIDVMLFLMTALAVLLLSVFAVFRLICCPSKRTTKSKLS
ncbi:uncharacterized protein LOC108236932 [Kryptolebias marmoratus]|nr:uncharacterized protein LOC108236932 [Kryptolebias marmoratus]